MKKIMSGYKGLFLSCLSMMLIVVCVCSFSFESRAATLEFDMPFERPSVSGTSGYIEILYQENGGYNSWVFHWNLVSNGQVGCAMDITITDHSINFKGSGASYMYIYMDTMWSGSDRMMFSGVPDPYHGYTYSHDTNKFASFHVYGNYGTVNTSIPYYSQSFIVNYGTDALLSNQLVDISNSLIQANANDKELIAKVNEILTSNKSIETKLDELIKLQKDTNSWLEKIWDSIQKFFTPDEKDKEESEKFENETNDKSDKLDDLNEQNKTDKTDIDGASNSVDENIDFESIDSYGKVLATITENQYIIQMLLLVFSVALVAYVLFGKK